MLTESLRTCESLEKYLGKDVIIIYKNTIGRYNLSPVFNYAENIQVAIDRPTAFSLVGKILKIIPDVDAIKSLGKIRNFLDNLDPNSSYEPGEIKLEDLFGGN